MNPDFGQGIDPHDTDPHPAPAKPATPTVGTPTSPPAPAPAAQPPPAAHHGGGPVRPHVGDEAGELIFRAFQMDHQAMLIGGSTSILPFIIRVITFLASLGLNWTSILAWLTKMNVPPAVIAQAKQQTGH